MANLHSKIILVKDINLDREYLNVLSYTEQQMVNLCRANKINEAEDYQFIRPSNSIYTNFKYTECLKANYIAFQNPDYDNKWFFAFIDDVIYQGEENTEITFTVDSWSTWFDYWTKKPCYIIRHHVNNDTIGLHTVPENLDIGEVKQESYDEFLNFGEDGNDYYFCINTTYDPTTGSDFEGVCKINGNLCGTFIFCFDVYSGSVGVPNITNFIDKTNKDGKINGIQELYILPKTLVDAIGTTAKHYSATLGSFDCKLLNDSSDVVTIAESFTKTHNFSGLNIKNNKCFVYPYNYLLLSNNCGNYNIYKYEDFSEDNPMFEIEMAVAVGCSCRIIPRGYKNIDYNYNESLPLAKFPTCSWSSDAFTNWLTQNAVNVVTQIANTGISGATGNYASVAGNIAGLIGDFRNAILAPNITGGNNTGDVNFSSRKNTFSLYHMRAKDEYMKIIDDYFTRYGYKIMRLETPNITGRAYWNYVEIGSNEDIGYGDVPTKYMEEINRSCRKGVTIWHNHSNIGNYNLNNTIV